MMSASQYDQMVAYDSIESYDSPLNPRLIRRDLFAVRDSDQLFNFQAVSNTGAPIDIQEFNVYAVIQEYECGTTFYPAQIEKIYPVDGIYQLKLDHQTSLTRSRYVYSIHATNPQQSLKLNYGYILIE